jgi:hypothetical protein
VLKAPIKCNYINIDLVNQLLILEPNIIEKEDIFQIKEIQVTIDQYEYISQFYLTTLYKKKKLTSFSGYPGLKI